MYYLLQATSSCKCDTMELIGEVKGCNVILVDDMIDTGGTL
jgi:phosphoribosylpyrophosphate synthetase